MSERIVPGLTFDDISRNAKRPVAVEPARWDTGMAVVEILMEMGVPMNVLADSTVGPDIPNKYAIGGGGAVVEFMPQWRYAIVDGGTSRRHVLFSTFAQTGDPKRPIATTDIPKEKIISNIKTAIAGVATSY